MNTNFFSQIAQMNLTGDLHLIISKGAERNLVVSVLLNNDQCGDEAKNLILPYNLKATANELDEHFFTRITTPMRAASALMDNMEAFIKQLEKAKKQSAIEKEKADREKKEKEAKEKKYKEAMTKADELEKEGKYREAWSKVPEPADFPEQAEEIRKRKRELSDKFSSPSLFETE